MIKHIRVRYQRARSQAPNVQPEIAATNAHARPLEFVEASDVAKRRVKITDHSVVSLDRLISFLHLNETRESQVCVS